MSDVSYCGGMEHVPYLSTVRSFFDLIYTNVCVSDRYAKFLRPMNLEAGPEEDSEDEELGRDVANASIQQHIRVLK